jgi:phosphoribosylformylglycinamidine cyclo-ligase
VSERYASTGVHLNAADEAKRQIAMWIAKTRTPLAVGHVGGFGGLVRVPNGYRRPVLVMSTDGVGTKVLVAARAGVHHTVGEDLVNHCVNDILVHGGRPLAFQDYIASGHLVPEIAASLVEGIARGCLAHDMTLAGGETAELPDLYAEGQYDLAGTIVGVVEEESALHGERIQPGDVLVGYASSGLHTNGYTLARHVVFDRLHLNLADPFPETGETVADVLLEVHRSYAAAITPVLPRVHALAHVTGGGIQGNLVRVLPPECEAVVEAGSWVWPPVFRVLKQAGEVSVAEMRRVFNLGIGMIAVVGREEVDAIRRAAEQAGVDTRLIGEIAAGPRQVRFTER